MWFLVYLRDWCWYWEAFAVFLYWNSYQFISDVYKDIYRVYNIYSPISHYWPPILHQFSTILWTMLTLSLPFITIIGGTVPHCYAVLVFFYRAETDVSNIFLLFAVVYDLRVHLYLLFFSVSFSLISVYTLLTCFFFCSFYNIVVCCIVS